MHAPHFLHFIAESEDDTYDMVLLAHPDSKSAGQFKTCSRATLLGKGDFCFSSLALLESNR